MCALFPLPRIGWDGRRLTTITEDPDASGNETKPHTRPRARIGSAARMTAYARRAERDGNLDAAQTMHAIAKLDISHAVAIAELLGLVGSLRDNVLSAVMGDATTHGLTYPTLASEARKAGDREAAELFRRLTADETEAAIALLALTGTHSAATAGRSPAGRELSSTRGRIQHPPPCPCCACQCRLRGRDRRAPDPCRRVADVARSWRTGITLTIGPTGLHAYQDGLDRPVGRGAGLMDPPSCRPHFTPRGDDQRLTDSPRPSVRLQHHSRSIHASSHRHLTLPRTLRGHELQRAAHDPTCPSAGSPGRLRIQPAFHAPDRPSSGVARYVSPVAAWARLEDELLAIAVNLLGPSETDELPEACADWVSATAKFAVAGVCEAALEGLVVALQRCLAPHLPPRNSP